MIAAKDAVVWINLETSEVKVRTQGCGDPRRGHLATDQHWCDPIGAAYSEWRKMTNEQRVRLMLETAIEMTMLGIPMKAVLTAFATVSEFRALGSASYPMCRALTSALIGRALEPNTMSFEHLLIHYRPKPKEVA